MVIRDAFDIEKHLMNVCPEWHRASQSFSVFFSLSSLFLAFVCFAVGTREIVLGLALRSCANQSPHESLIMIPARHQHCLRGYLACLIADELRATL